MRVNTLHTTDEKFEKILQSIGISYQIAGDVPHCFELKCGDLVNKLESADKNCYYYQDKASQWACLAFGAQPGEAVADVCAAPGGKSFPIAQISETRVLIRSELYTQAESSAFQI